MDGLDQNQGAPLTQQEEEEQNFIKSIIYGNQVKNSYGTFRAFCSAISQKEQIEKIIYYLKEKENFKKYNKIVYAFRLYVTPTFFVTQDVPKLEPKFVEGYQEDPTIEGSGEKLMHLLQKFNVENVLIIVGIEQYNPLNKFEAIHFRIIVERAKDLLNNLYSRVVQSEIENISENTNFLPESSSMQIKRQVKLKKQIYHLPQLQQEPKFARPQDRQNNRPNHIFYNSKPTFLKHKTDQISQEVVERRKQIKILGDKLKQQAYQLEKILSSIDARDYLQLRFAIQYDQNKLTEKLLNIFMIIADVSSREQLAYEYDLKSGLEGLTVNNLNEQKIKIINEMIRGDKRLTLDSVSKQNEALGPLFGFIQVLMRSYENGKALRKLQETEKQFQLFQQYQKSMSQGMIPDIYNQSQSNTAKNISTSQTLFNQNQQNNQIHNNIALQENYYVESSQKIPEYQNESLIQSGELQIKPNKIYINQPSKIKKSSQVFN
ncbi:hypothetical protein ABPG74_002374 [Tetrahymena malaccensis]